MWKVVKNTEAVVLMAEGRYKDAVCLFHDVLRDIREICSDEEMISMQSTMASPHRHEFATVPLQDPVEGRDDAEGLVFHRAFLLPTEDPLDLKSALVLILFNLSLSVHVKAIHDGKTADLLKAFALYKKAHQVSIGFDYRAAMQLTPVLAATVHNMGSICRAFYQHEHHQVLREVLSHFLTAYGPLVIGNEAYAFFQRSLYFDKITATHGAPAA